MPLSFGDEDHATPGTHVQANCIVSEGDLPVEIRWTFRPDGARERAMNDAGITTTQLGSRSSILLIDSVSPEHSGEYACTAKNAAGSQSVTAHLRVLGTRSDQSRPICRPAPSPKRASGLFSRDSLRK